MLTSQRPNAGDGPTRCSRIIKEASPAVQHRRLQRRNANGGKMGQYHRKRNAWLSGIRPEWCANPSVRSGSATVRMSPFIVSSTHAAGNESGGDGAMTVGGVGWCDWCGRFGSVPAIWSKVGSVRFRGFTPEPTAPIPTSSPGGVSAFTKQYGWPLPSPPSA